MEEQIRIKKLFSDWYNGNPWSCIKLMDVLADVSSEQAALHPIPGSNSIWQLVQHCLGWRDNVLRKLQGEVFTSPEDNYLAEPGDTSPQAWQDLMTAIEKNEAAWQQYLEGINNDILDSGYKPSKNEFTVYELIHGILHHDNYHVGQIVMLKKIIQLNG